MARPIEEEPGKRTRCLEGGWVTGLEHPLPEDASVFYSEEGDITACNRILCSRCGSWVRHFDGVCIGSDHGDWEALAHLYQASTPPAGVGLPSARYRSYFCRCHLHASIGGKLLSHLDTEDIDDWACAGHPEGDDAGTFPGGDAFLGRLNEPGALAWLERSFAARPDLVPEVCAGIADALCSRATCEGALEVLPRLPLDLRPCLMSWFFCPADEWGRDRCERRPELTLLGLAVHTLHEMTDADRHWIVVPPHLLRALTRPEDGWPLSFALAAGNTQVRTRTPP
jgi:hypothetical protein